MWLAPLNNPVWWADHWDRTFRAANRNPYKTPRLEYSFDELSCPSPDLILCTSYNAERYLPLGVPMIVFDGHDNLHLTDDWFGPGRTLAQNPLVKFIVKGAVYTNAHMHNVSTVEGSLTGTMVWSANSIAGHPLAQRMYPAQSQTPTLSEEEIKKVVAICGVPFNQQLQQLRNWVGDLRMDNQGLAEHVKRPIDVLFLGSGACYTREYPRFHRSLCMGALRSLPADVIVCSGVSLDKSTPLIRGSGKTAYNPWPDGGQHFQLMLQSKIVVSPWGWSEVSARDYEAVMAGCLFVKPALNSIKSWPPIYQYHPGINCKPDFSDLTHVIMSELGEWKEIGARRAMNACNELRSITNPAAPINSYAYQIQQLIMRALNGK